MRRCLVLANQTLGGEQLAAAVRERAAAEEHEFYVVVPATPLHDDLVVAGSGPSPDDRAYAVAQQRLDRALDEIRGLGATADGEVGPADALEAARLALLRFAADEVVVSTLPLGLSRWLRGNLPAKVEKMSQLPVTHLVGSETAGG